MNNIFLLLFIIFGILLLIVIIVDINFTLKQEVPPKIIKELLNYIYQDCLLSRDVSVVSELEKLATKLQMANLQKWCKFLLELNNLSEEDRSSIFSIPITSTLPADILFLYIILLYIKYYNLLYIKL